MLACPLWPMFRNSPFAFFQASRSIELCLPLMHCTISNTVLERVVQVQYWLSRQTRATKVSNLHPPCVFAGQFGDNSCRWEPDFPRPCRISLEFPDFLQKFHGHFPGISVQRFPRSSPDIPRSNRASPEVRPSIWEARHHLITHK